MNKLTRVFSIVILASIGLWLAVNSHDVYADQNHQIGHRNSHAKVYSIDTPDLIGLSTEKETSLKHNNNPPPATPKNPAQIQPAYVLLFNQLMLVRFTQYLVRTTNARLKYRKSDLIFPFHYFW
ncbi:MAG: hypothetical protein IPN29_05500 [Saprospiraceae bacterium]|nr:hypothetical protein [Saprospiraceae bacterium]